jgi:histidinol dehydrogenase
MTPRRGAPEDLLRGRWPNVEAADAQLLEYVGPIVNDVRVRGDDAVREYTRKFDGVEIGELKVQPDETSAAYDQVEEGQIRALEELKRRLKLVEGRRLELLSFDVRVDGVDVGCSVRPLRSVGCYVPGGRAAYPSSLVMNVVPAKVAGVEQVVVCTPPGENGVPPALTLVAADMCGVGAVYKVGGVQAVASMAFGTDTIPKVDKIVGPGNRYVTAAKTAVSSVVAIDKPAGPSEVLILADGAANAKLIALDLVSQAEHGRGGVSGLVTTSSRLANEVSELLQGMSGEVPRAGLVSEVMAEGGFIHVVEGIPEAVEFVNLFAPEHLEIHAENPRGIAGRISTAGLIQIGPYTPVSSTDYCVGVNHVLPTGGYARISSGITVLDYVRLVSVVEASKPGLEAIRGHVRALAEAEGLPNHALAMEGRFINEAE